MSAITTPALHPLRPQNFSELMEFAKMAARSTLVPRDYLGKPENIVLAIQMGSEIGLAPMQSLQNISVINGRPAVWGDAMLGLCKQSQVCKDVIERFEGDGKTLTAVCTAERVGKKPVEWRFSMDDAERAGLASKAGTWQLYPKRMLQMRARGFALRDAFPDVLRGLISVEEAQDIPEEKPASIMTIEAEPDAREEINREVPPKDVRAAEKKPVPTSFIRQSSAARTDDQWRAWLEKLRAACAVLYRRSEVVEVGNRASVGDAIATGPAWVQAEVSAILAENYAKFGDASEETDEVHVVGEEKLGAG